MQKDVLRRVICILFVVALAGAPLPAPAETSLLVGRSVPTADAELAAQVAFELGFFKRHGLDVKFVDFSGGSKLIQAMTSGSIGIGVGAATAMALVAKGAPVLAVCENTATLPYFAVGVPWDAPVHKLADLEGKRIAVSSLGSLTDWLAQELIRKQGWSPDTTPRVAIGGNPVAVAAAFRTHVVDAYIGGTINFQRMEATESRAPPRADIDLYGPGRVGQYLRFRSNDEKRSRHHPRFSCGLDRDHRLYRAIAATRRKS